MKIYIKETYIYTEETNIEKIYKDDYDRKNSTELITIKKTI